MKGLVKKGWGGLGIGISVKDKDKDRYQVFDDSCANPVRTSRYKCKHETSTKTIYHRRRHLKRNNCRNETIALGSSFTGCFKCGLISTALPTRVHFCTHVQFVTSYKKRCTYTKTDFFHCTVLYKNRYFPCFTCCHITSF